MNKNEAYSIERDSFSINSPAHLNLFLVAYQNKRARGRKIGKKRIEQVKSIDIVGVTMASVYTNRADSTAWLLILRVFAPEWPFNCVSKAATTCKRRLI